MNEYVTKLVSQVVVKNPDVRQIYIWLHKKLYQ